MPLSETLALLLETLAPLSETIALLSETLAPLSETTAPRVLVLTIEV